MDFKTTLKSSVATAAFCAMASLLFSTPALADNHNGTNWSGLYIGGSAGWVGSDVDAFWPNRGAGLEGNFEHDDDGGIFGGHIGYQQQFDQLVVGVEFAITRINTDNVSGTPNAGCPNPAFTCQTRLDDLIYTLGPRLGWASSHQWMPYITGGYAKSKVETRSFTTATGVIFDTTRNDQHGWFLGGGIEYAVRDNILFGLEYQHIDLGNELHISPSGSSTNDREADPKIDIVRVRLTYKF